MKFCWFVTRSNMLAFVALLVVAQCVVGLPSNFKEYELHPDTGLDIFQLAEKYNYPIEKHGGIQTEDGYILEMHRIPYGVKSGPAENKPVVFLMHGLLCSSVDWINMGPEKGLGFILADMGYDVWMGNARGNTWSRKHVTLDPDGSKEDEADFWAFSWNEIGSKDLPAMIDYALEHTNQEKLYYIGHSQGTTSFFVMAAERPEYNDKIRLFVALAPIGYINNTNTPLLVFIAAFEGPLDFLTSLIGMHEFHPNIELISKLGNVFCSDGAVFQELCSSAIFLICGWDSEQFDESMFTVITTNAPAGSSARQFVHYAQGINSRDFKKYDFGRVQNLIQYGQGSPPSYDLTNIRAPVALFYSKNDGMAAVQDVERLAAQLPNLVLQYLIPYDKFNHVDFIWATDVVSLLYNEVYRVMELY